jgi:hypothetical protein
MYFCNSILFSIDAPTKRDELQANKSDPCLLDRSIKHTSIPF